MHDIRRIVLWGLCGAVVLGLLIAGGVYQYQKSHTPNAGLTLWRETQMDDATRSLFSQRLATTQAAIAAKQSAGEVIETDLYASLAFDAYVLGDLAVARAAYEHMLNENSLYSVAWNEYAKVLDDMGDYQGAESAFLQAIETGKLEQYYISYVEFLQHRFPERDEAVKIVLEQGVIAVGQKQLLMVHLGDWYAEHGDCDRAIAHFNVAKTLNPAAKESIEQKIAEAREICAQ